LANTKSALKQWRASLKRRARIRSTKTAVKTFVTSAVAAVRTQSAEAKAVVDRAVQALDKAVGKNVLHPNNAARRKSRLVKKLNAAQQVEAAAAPESATPAKRTATPRRRATATRTTTPRTPRPAP